MKRLAREVGEFIPYFHILNFISIIFKVIAHFTVALNLNLRTCKSPNLNITIQDWRWLKKWTFVTILRELHCSQARRFVHSVFLDFLEDTHQSTNTTAFQVAFVLMIISPCISACCNMQCLHAVWKHRSYEKDEGSWPQRNDIWGSMGGKIDSNIFYNYNSSLFPNILPIQVIHLYKTFVMMKKEDLPKEIRDKKWQCVAGVSQMSVDDILYL